MFSYEFGEILKNNFFIEHLRWLLLRLLKFTLNQILHVLQIPIFWYKNLIVRLAEAVAKRRSIKKVFLKFY